MTALRQGWLVARREMRERARSRGFRISTLLMLLIVIAMIVLPGLLDTSDHSKDVGISGATCQRLARILSTPGVAPGDTTIHLHRYPDLAAGEQALRDEHVDVLVVDARRLEWRGKADAELQALVTGAIQVATVQQRAAAAGVDPETVTRMLSPVPVASVQIGTAPGRSAGDETAAALMSVVLLAAIVIYGNLVLTGVVEEKSSRVVEVLLARVPGRSLLGGKVVGIGLLGFGQLALTACAALVASVAADSVDLPAVAGGVLFWVLAWFALGYALYSMIYGALGSLASRTEDAQSVAGPVSYVLLAGYWASLLAISEDPDGLWARVLSLFPATAPLAMPGRIALGVTAWWEPPLAVVLTLAAIAALTVVAGRVYLNAVLHTGATLHLRDVWRTTPQEHQDPPTPHTQKVTLMFSTVGKPMIWSIVLATIGVAAAAVILILTRDVLWSVVALLLTVAAVRRILQHR